LNRFRKENGPVISNVFSGRSVTSVLLLRNVPSLNRSRIRTLLEAKGEPIGANDYLVAAIIAAVQGILVTGNVREFRKVPGLKLENWLAA
jgi:tRNA(fMet)-specific endonuclease VapC